MNVSMGDVANAFKFQGSDAVMRGMQKRPMPSAVPHGLPHRRRLPPAPTPPAPAPAPRQLLHPAPPRHPRPLPMPQGGSPSQPWRGGPTALVGRADHPVPGDCRQRIERRQPPRQPLGATQHLAKDALKKATDMASHLAAPRVCKACRKWPAPRRPPNLLRPRARRRLAPLRHPKPPRQICWQPARGACTGGQSQAVLPPKRPPPANCSQKAPAKRLPPSHRASGEGGAHPPQVARWPDFCVVKRAGACQLCPGALKWWTMTLFLLAMPPIPSGAWRLRWFWRSCAHKWRCPPMPRRPRWACFTSPTTTPMTRANCSTIWPANCPR